MNKSKVKFLAAFLGLALLATVGCKRVSPQKTKTQSSDSSCACSDMACWEKSTNDAVKNQIGCASAALGSAAALSTGGSVAATRFFLAASNLLSIGNASLTLSTTGQDTTTVVGLVRALVYGERALLFTAFGSDALGSPALSCFQNGTSTTLDIISVYNELTAIPSDASSTGLMPYLQVINKVTLNSWRLVGLATTLTECTKALVTLNPTIAKSITDFFTAFRNVMAPVMVASALLNCGVNITNGAILLGENTICLAADFDNLAKSTAKLNSSIDKATKTPAPNGSVQSCNEQDLACNTYGMQKFGMWLRGQSSGWFQNRPKYCASMCGNSGSGQPVCLENSVAIFTESDSNVCKKVCEAAQCPNAVSICLSFCCEQDASCAEAAQTILDKNP